MPAQVVPMSGHDSEIQKIFARNLKRARGQRGWSQEELALAAGIDRTYVSGCERGVRNPSIIVLERIATALDVKPSVLLDVDDDS